MNTYISKLQIGYNSDNAAPLASTMLGVCNSSTISATKVVTFNKFDTVEHGVTIFVKFTNGNSVSSGVKLQVGASQAYDVTGNCVCDIEAIIGFTFDEVDSTHRYWRVNSSGITDAMKNYITNVINTTTDTPDVIIIKGGVGTGGDPGYLPSHGYETGWAYTVVSNGTFLGQACKTGDLIIAVKNAVQNQSAIDPNHWIILQGKLQNVVFSEFTSTTGHVAMFDDSTGKYIIDSGYTIESSVPPNAIFTDTTYDEGNGITIDSHNRINVEYGTTANTAAEGNDSRLSDARTPLPHTHGNISDDGYLGTGNALLRTTYGEIEAGPTLGNNTNTFLNNTGEWAEIDFPVTSVNGQTGEVTLNLSDFGLTAMRLIGQATVNIEPNSRTNPEISSYNFNTDKQDGDVILGKNDGREYVWLNDTGWILLGQEASTVLDSDLLSVDLNEDNNIWISQISQNTDRTITVKRGALNTSGTWSGNATTATSWANAQIAYVDLESAGTNSTINGGQASAQILNVNGILGIENGGTGADTFSQNQVILSNEISGESTASALTSRAYIDVNITNNIPVARTISTSNNFMTEAAIYAGLPTINNAHDYTSESTIFAPISRGTEYQILVASNSNAPVWTQAAFISSIVSSTLNAEALTTLILGNNVAKTSNGEHSEGKIILYSGGTGSHSLIGNIVSTVTEYEHKFLNADGYIVQLTSAAAVGGSNSGINQAVYVDANGIVQPIKYTPHRLYYSGDADAQQSESSQFLPSNHYASATQISINSTNAPTSGILFVNGNSTFAGVVNITDTTVAAATSPNPTGALLVSGGIFGGSNLYIQGTTSLNGNTTIGAVHDSTSNYTLSIYGSTRIVDSGSGDLAYLDISTVNNTSSLLFYPYVDMNGQIGLYNKRWKEGYFSTAIRINNDGNSYINLETVDSNTNAISLIEMLAEDPTINLISRSNLTTYTWSIDNSIGTLSIENNSLQNPVTLIGNALGFSVAPRLYINSTIPADPPYVLSVTGDSYISSKLYIGANTTYGDPYLPIYWNDGVPTQLNGVTQSKNFTFSIGDTSITLTSPAYDTTLGVNTYVTDIVVTSGIENLNGIISWASGQTNGEIVLTTPATSGTVSGYIITARGCDAPVPTVSNT